MVRLFVLGLLYARPRHGYEIRKWLETRRTDLWTGVLPGSIYHALKQMTKEGLVRNLEVNLRVPNQQFYGDDLGISTCTSLISVLNRLYSL